MGDTENVEDRIIHERYRELAVAIIQRQIDDYLSQGDKYSDYSLYKWMMHCEWFNYLGIDPEYVYVKCVALKENHKKRRKKYGKENKE